MPIRIAAVLILGASGSAVAAAGTAGAAPRPALPAVQRLVTLERGHEVFARPDRRSPRRATVHRRRPITGGRTVLPLLRELTAGDGRRWLRVRLPGRPNGHAGWISSRATRFGRTGWGLLAEPVRRRVTVFRDGRVVRRFRAVVGKPSTPTPLGHFFVEETVKLPRGRAGAPFALALSARSSVLHQFAGGPGQIALHGLDRVGGVPGTAASHGCLRLENRNVRWLAARIGPGVPVTIRGRATGLRGRAVGATAR